MEVNRLVKAIRMGAYAQEDRRAAARQLGKMFGDDRLIDAANKLQVISVAELDFMPFQTLQQRDGKLWQILNEVLDANGHPPATTFKETMRGIGKATPEQIARWYGDEARAYIRETFKTEKYRLLEYARILNILANPEDVDILAILFENESDFVREQVALALGKIGTPEAMPMLVNQLEFEKGFRTVPAIATALGQFNDPTAISALKNILETNQDNFARKNAGMSLIALGHVDAVVTVMNTHSDKFFRLSAGDALAAAEDTATTLPYLVQVIETHADYMVRLAAVKRLGELQDDSAFAPLVEVLKKDTYPVKIAAVDALPYGNRAVDALGSCVADVNMPEWATEKNKPSVSEKAKQGLAAIGTPEALEMMTRWS